VEFESRIVRQELREHVRLMNPSVERGKRFVSICGWCKKIALPNGQWVEVEEAVRVLNLFDEPQLPTLTHGICGECTASFLKSWTHDGKTE
jgi:hypothetical protein